MIHHQNLFDGMARFNASQVSFFWQWTDDFGGLSLSVQFASTTFRYDGSCFVVDEHHSRRRKGKQVRLFSFTKSANPNVNRKVECTANPATGVLELSVYIQ